LGPGLCLSVRWFFCFKKLPWAVGLQQSHLTKTHYLLFYQCDSLCQATTPPRKYLARRC
jgi:hypothetical protein